MDYQTEVQVYFFNTSLSSGSKAIMALQILFQYYLLIAVTLKKTKKEQHTMALFPPSYLKIRIRKIRCSFLGGARFETGKHGSTRGIVFTAVNISVFRWLRKNKSVWIMEIRYRTLILILGQFCFDFDRPKISTNLKSVNSFGVYPLKTIKHVRPF